MKTCGKCNEAKSLSSFHKDLRKPDRLRTICKSCCATADKARRKANPEKFASNWKRWSVANRVHLLHKGSERRLRKRALCMIATARTRARRRSLKFDLDQHVEELQARINIGRCEVTGVPLNLGGGRTFDSPSLDRIDPGKGYVYSNIRVVCNLINCALGDWGEDTLRTVIKQWVSGRTERVA